MFAISVGLPAAPSRLAAEAIDLLDKILGGTVRGTGHGIHELVPGGGLGHRRAVDGHVVPPSFLEQGLPLVLGLGVDIDGLAVIEEAVLVVEVGAIHAADARPPVVQRAPVFGAALHVAVELLEVPERVAGEDLPGFVLALEELGEVAVVLEVLPAEVSELLL